MKITYKPELSDALKSEARASLEKLYAEIQRRDLRGEFKIKEASGDASVSFERYNWVNRGGKHSHRYCVRTGSEKPFRTEDFNIAVFTYYLKLNLVKLHQNVHKPRFL